MKISKRKKYRLRAWLRRRLNLRQLIYPQRMSLRAKGIIGLAVVSIYLGVLATVLTNESMKLPAIVQELERHHRREESLVQLNMQTARTIVALADQSKVPLEGLPTKTLTELAILTSYLEENAKNRNDFRASAEAIRNGLRDLAHEANLETMKRAQGALHDLATELHKTATELGEQRRNLLVQYNQAHDQITLKALFLIFTGVIVCGAVVTIFFTRLTWDIRRAGSRAMAIVKGYGGPPLIITRSDEIGELAQAINSMQQELRNRERELVIARSQHFHHEKMAAVGTIAAAIAHEINNPIMAIAGLARALESGDIHATDQAEEGVSVTQTIIQQANRISQITRQLSEFSRPQSPKRELLDLNTLVKSTVSFVKFDTRFRRIQVSLQLDSELPAIEAVADHVSQIIINLLLNSADAFIGTPTRTPKVQINTWKREHLVVLSVSDNGAGMTEEVRQKACDEFFTTKTAGTGTGIGLFICKTFMAENGGSLDIESTLGTGTTVSLGFSVT